VHLTFTPKHLQPFDRGALNLMFWGVGQESIPYIGYTLTRWAYLQFANDERSGHVHFNGKVRVHNCVTMHA